jgi:hypothetical protein
MLKRTFLVSTLVALAVSGSTAVSLAAGWHGGGCGFGAAPESVIPASADLYVGLNLGGAQGAALSQLWAAYQTHPGTAAALAHLRTAMGRTSVLRASRLLSSLGARAGIALWVPATNGPAAQPRVAIVAPLRVSTFLSATGPLSDLAGFSPIASYLGTIVYRNRREVAAADRAPDRAAAQRRGGGAPGWGQRRAAPDLHRDQAVTVPRPMGRRNPVSAPARASRPR